MDYVINSQHNTLFSGVNDRERQEEIKQQWFATQAFDISWQ